MQNSISALNNQWNHPLTVQTDVGCFRILFVYNAEEIEDIYRPARQPRDIPTESTDFAKDSNLSGCLLWQNGTKTFFPYLKSSLPKTFTTYRQKTNENSSVDFPVQDKLIDDKRPICATHLQNSLMMPQNQKNRVSRLQCGNNIFSGAKMNQHFSRNTYMKYIELL